MDTHRDLAHLIERARTEADPEHLRAALVQALLGLGEADAIGLEPLLAGVGSALDGRWPGSVADATVRPIRRVS